MGGKPYVRSEKGIKGGKWEVGSEDKEDFEQEKLIQQWLNSQGNAGEFEFKHITSNGTARNTLIKASISLDQQISEDGAGTFADLIAGCDGRDLFGGGDADESPFEAREIIHGYLFALGFTKGEIEWLETTLKLSIAESKSRFAILVSDLEW